MFTLYNTVLLLALPLCAFSVPILPLRSNATEAASSVTLNSTSMSASAAPTLIPDSQSAQSSGIEDATSEPTTIPGATGDSETADAATLQSTSVAAYTLAEKPSSTSQSFSTSFTDELTTLSSFGIGATPQLVSFSGSFTVPTLPSTVSLSQISSTNSEMGSPGQSATSTSFTFGVSPRSSSLFSSKTPSTDSTSQTTLSPGFTSSFTASTDISPIPSSSIGSSSQGLALTTFEPTSTPSLVTSSVSSAEPSSTFSLSSVFEPTISSSSPFSGSFTISATALPSVSAPLSGSSTLTSFGDASSSSSGAPLPLSTPSMSTTKIPVEATTSVDSFSTTQSSSVTELPAETTSSPDSTAIATSTQEPSGLSSFITPSTGDSTIISASPTTISMSSISASSSPSISSRISGVKPSHTGYPHVPVPIPTTGPTEISAYLSGHNSVRAEHGADPLNWSEDLAAKARSWAEGCQFRHTDGALGPLGDNLTAGTGDFTAAKAVAKFTDEAYDPKHPSFNHLTQVIWKSTTELGCGVALCDNIFRKIPGPAMYHVCLYNPVGNVVGQESVNVQA
ncbi:unnamed protein product [Somion occarium]|uniref:SCP domain-containing protein n=1 Tax=Somion occarium TaxID=3059160 RepID=A0ABP1D026_9APHY